MNKPASKKQPRYKAAKFSKKALSMESPKRIKPSVVFEKFCHNKFMTTYHRGKCGTDDCYECKNKWMDKNCEYIWNSGTPTLDKIEKMARKMR